MVTCRTTEEEKDKLLPPPSEESTPSDGEVVPLTDADRLLPATDSRYKGMKAFVAGASGT